MIAASPQRLRWSADRFYWTIIDGADLPVAAAKRRIALSYLFEATLPLPLDEVHCDFVRIPGGSSYLGCAVSSEVLDTDCSDAITLRPESLPRCLSDSDLPDDLVDELNLLTGSFEPQAIGRQRSRWLRELVLAVVVLVTFCVMGLERRTQLLDEQASLIDAERLQLATDVLGPSALARSVLPADRLLIAERRRLEQTRVADSADIEVDDASVALESLLAAWPSADLHVQTESVTVTPSAMTVNAMVASAADAQAVATHLHAVEGWDATQPRIDSVRDEVRLTLRLAPQEHGQ